MQRTLIRIFILIAASLILGILRNFLFPGGLNFQANDQSRTSQDSLGLEIEVSAAYQMYRDSVQFIDARSPAEYNESHIPGALNIPAGASFEEKTQLTASLDPGEKYVVYCNDPECPVSHQLYEYLQFAEFANVHLMYEGITVWTEEGYPVTGAEGGANDSE